MSPEELTRIIAENKALKSRVTVTPNYFNPVPYYTAHPLSFIKTNYNYRLSDLRSQYVVHTQTVCDKGEAGPIFIEYQQFLDLAEWITLKPSGHI